MKKNAQSIQWLLFCVVLLVPTFLFLGCQAVEREPVNDLEGGVETADIQEPGSGGETAATVLPQGSGGSYPILFATQIPIRDDFVTIGSTFGNHEPSMQQAARGGDLYIRYPNGVLKNLTQLAGYGSAGEFQDDDSIAVRDPAVHWDGNKAIFSMVIGAPEQQYQWETYYWQLYEVTGLGQGDRCSLAVSLKKRRTTTSEEVVLVVKVGAMGAGETQTKHPSAQVQQTTRRHVAQNGMRPAPRIRLPGVRMPSSVDSSWALRWMPS
jgi:hypothetical protein